MKDRLRQSLLCLLPIFGLTVLSLVRNPWAYYNDDMQSEFIPAFHEIVRQLSQGHFPLLSGNSWYGGNLSGEAQYGLFSPLLLTLYEIMVHSQLPERFQAAFFSFFHQCVLAVGMYWLAASYGLPRSYRHFCAVAVVFAGWSMRWTATAGPPMLITVCWMPWMWMAMREYQKTGKMLFWGLLVWGTFCVLNLTSPWCWLFMCVLVPFHFVETLVVDKPDREKFVADLLRILLAYLTGLLLSAPNMLAFLAGFSDSNRSGVFGTGWLWMRSVPPKYFLFSFMPFYRENMQYLWMIPREVSGLDLVGLQVPVLAVVACFISRVRLSRHHSMFFFLCVAVAGFSMLPTIPPFRWSHRWLMFLGLLGPLFGAILHHESEKVRRIFPVVAGVIVPVLALIACALQMKTGAGLDPISHAALAFAGGTILVVLYSVHFHKQGSGLDCLGIALAAAVCFLAMPREPISPCWPFAEQANSPQFNPQVRYVQFLDHNALYGPSGDTCILDYPITNILHANRGMLANVEFIDGYSPMFYKRYLTVWGTVGETTNVPPQFLEKILAPYTSADGFLANLGVDGLVLPAAYAPLNPVLEKNGWVKASEAPEATIWHRHATLEPKPVATSVTSAAKVSNPEVAMQATAGQGQAPGPDGKVAGWITIVETRDGDNKRYPFQSLKFSVVESLPAHCTIHQDEATTAPALVIFHRPWWHGYVAYKGQQKLPVYRANSIEMAVEVPAGQPGNITLDFSPEWLHTATLPFFGGLVLVIGFPLYMRQGSQEGKSNPTRE